MADERNKANAENGRKDAPAGRARRRWLRVGIPAAVVVVLVVAAQFLVPAGLVRDLVASRLTAALGRPVTVGEAKGGILPRPWIELRDLAVAPGPEGAAADVAAVRLRLRWLPLLRREVEIDQAELRRPRVRVQLAAAATGTGTDTAGAAAPPPAASPVTLRIEHFVITDGSLRVVRPDSTPVVDLVGLAEDLSLLATPDGDVVVVGTTHLDTLRLHLPGGTLGEGLPITWKKDLRWEAGPRRLKVITSDLALGALPVAVTGEVTGLGGDRPVADLDLAGGPAQLATLQGYLPSNLLPDLAGVTSSGTASLQASLAGPVMAGPDSLDWSVHFSLTDGAVSAPQLASPLHDIALVVAARPGRIDLENLAARTDHSSLSLHGRVDDPLADPSYTVAVDADVDLAEAMALQPPQPDAPTVTGGATAQVTATGRAADPASLRLVGPVAARGVGISGPAMSLPVTDLNARGSIDGRVLKLDELALRQGRSDYRITGTVTDPLALAPQPLPGAPDVATVNLRLASRRLDVDQIMAAGQAAKTAAKTASAPGGGSGGAASPPPPAALEYLTKVSGTADARIDTLVIKGTRLTQVAGTAKADRGRITVESAEARAYGGQADLSGTVDLSDPRAGRLDLELGVKGAQAREFFAETTTAGRFSRLATALSGVVDLKASLAGDLDDTLGLDLATLASQGDVQVQDAHLTGLPLQNRLVSLLDAPQLETLSFADLMQPFSISNGRLEINKLQIKAGPVTLRGSGWQDLTGRISAHLDLTLPPEYARGLRRQLPAQMADLLLDAEGTAVELPVNVSGTSSDPDVRLDTDKLAKAAAARAEARLTREKDRVKQEALKEASSALQDLLKAPADSTTAGADSTKPQTLEDVGKSLFDRLKKKGGG